MSTIKSFVKQFIATVKGDDVAAQAEKAFRQASSALKTQINSLEGDTVTFEDAIEEAKEAQATKRINGGQPITLKADYVEKLLQAKNAVTKAEDNMKLHQKKIDFLKEELATLEQEVEVVVPAKDGSKA